MESSACYSGGSRPHWVTFEQPGADSYKNSAIAEFPFERALNLNTTSKCDRTQHPLSSRKLGC